jgi:sugar phosphate isomerase/epimerase
VTWPLLNADWNFWPEQAGREAAWERCAELDFDGLELGVYAAGEELSGERLAELAALEARHGIGVRAVLFSLPPARWPEGAFSSRTHAGRAVGEAVEVGLRAAELGLDAIGIWPGADVLAQDTTYGDAWPRLVESFARVDARLAGEGVRTAVEYKPFELVSGPDAALRLCENVGSETIGVLLDTGHALWAAEDLAVVVDMLGARLLHVHLGDSPPGAEGDLPPGRVHDFVPFFGALARSGYGGALSLDMYGAVADGIAGAGAASREARDYVRGSIELGGARA